MLTLCIVSALGGCESQVKAHVRGNLNVGNDKETMITAITHCLPYMGFPRTLNALSCVNEVTPEKYQ
jgi:4-carboxymuconolactone decarboxylase